MAELDRAGNFKARILSYGLSKSKSSASMGINCRMVMTAFKDGDDWRPWEEYQQEAYGTMWFQGKDGKTNNKVVESMARVFPTWTGDFAEFGNGVIGETDCEVTVEDQGEYGLKVAWINPIGGGGSRESTFCPEDAKLLNSAHGAACRATVGNVRRETPAKPPAPAEAPKPDDKEVPF